ncbi:MAG: hypothetical protein KAH24_07475, partial [Holophagae bacterium]|nr:hypothetical protein [Holophagae bacterium]
MKRVLFFLVLFLMIWAPVVHGQESGELRLFLEPGMTELPGDGDATVTITVTLRDSEGELVNKGGTVHLKLNAGRLSQGQVKLRNGIGQVV